MSLQRQHFGRLNDQLGLHPVTYIHDQLNRPQKIALGSKHMDRFAHQADATRAMDGIDIFTQSALKMLTSGAARRAFDLNEESQATRDRYGRHRWGQMALLARRLVESGVTFVTLNTGPDSLCWDWHRHIVNDNRPADGSDGPTPENLT